MFCKFTAQNFKMNLAIDIGNSRTKVAVFHKNEILWHSTIEKGKLSPAVKTIIIDFPKLDRAIISSVGKKESEAIDFLNERLPLIELGPFTKVPFSNQYETPESLGLDRLALVSAAFKKFPNKNCLVIDAGTCITYDFLDEKGNYQGGAISPGIQMKFNALHTFTEKLPLITTIENEPLSEKTTLENIRKGVIMGTSFEIDGFIAFYLENYRNLTVILTGGDSLLLSNSIKNSIFATSNFLLEGLNAILEFNTTQ